MAAKVDVSIVILGITLVGTPLLYRRIRTWALGIECALIDTTERSHRLRRGQMVVIFASLAAGFAIFAISAAVQGPTHHSAHSSAKSGAAGLLDLAALILYVFGFVSAYRAIRPSYARVREIDRKVPYRARRIGVGVVFGVVFVGTLAIATHLAPRHGAGHVLGIAIAYALAILVVNALLAPLWLVALNAETLPSDTHRRLMALNQSVQARVRDIKSFPATGQKIANAVQVGLIPGLRYILISDYLVDNMSSDEVDAVVGHELGHARGNHLAIKLLGVATIWTVLEAISAAVRGGAGVALFIGFPIAFLLTQGLLGVHLEKKADDAAARYVGPQHLASALEKLGDLNHTRRHTSWTWNLLGQHPGLDERIGRLLRPSQPEVVA